MIGAFDLVAVANLATPTSLTNRSSFNAFSRARSRAEWNSKIGVVAEEADEAVHWLEFVLASDLAKLQRVGPLLREAKELRAIFAASAATSRRNRRRQKDQ